MNYVLNSNPVISVIIPCYNVGSKMTRFMNSLLNQTYTNLQLIFINDGSCDDTLDVIASYRERLIRKGMLVEIKTKANGGLVSAINEGLQLVKGDYIIWPDPDDWLENNSIELRAKFLEEHKEYACVSTNYYIYDSKDFSRPIKLGITNSKNAAKEDQFELLLRYKSEFCPGTHMVRTSAFFETHPGKVIFNGGRGQNYQMLLPVYYRRKRAYIDEPLYNYVIYTDSMSHSDDTEDKALAHCNEHYCNVVGTINSMKISENDRKKYLTIASNEDRRQKFYVALLFKDWSKAGNLLTQYRGEILVKLRMTIQLVWYRMKG